MSRIPAVLAEGMETLNYMGHADLFLYTNKIVLCLFAFNHRNLT